MNWRHLDLLVALAAGLALGVLLAHVLGALPLVGPPSTPAPTVIVEPGGK